jgi:tetratricopeptide (TPR) repeat protein
MKLKSTPSEQSIRRPSLPFGLCTLLAVTLGLATVILYWPATYNKFVDYDDNTYVVLNDHVKNGLTFENLKWSFCHVVSGNWHPVTMLSHMLDCQLYGLNPWGHHLTSLLFHAANAILLFLLLQRPTGALWRSAWVAAIFAFHPLHVESVAWVAERKDVLSTFFGFLSLMFYVRYVHWKRTLAGDPETGPFLVSRDYWLACLCLALGLMCKPMLVTWPFVLLLLDYWPLGRFQTGRIRSLVREKIPFFILSFASCVTTFIVQKQEGAMATVGQLTLLTRCDNVLISYCRYLSKLFWPVDLAFFYPMHRYGPPVCVLAVVTLAGLSGLIWFQRRRWPYLLTGWLWFLGTLVPVIGLIQVGGQSIADRYTYIPSVGILILVSWGVYALTKSWRHQILALSLAGSATVFFCCVTTRTQIGYWKDSEALARHALAVTSDNFVAHNSLAWAYCFEQGRTNDAVGEYQLAIQAYPDFAEAHLNLGRLFASMGQTNPALNELTTAAELAPARPDVHFFLGNLLFRLGQTDAGVGQFKNAVNFKAGDAGSGTALVNLLLETGQTNAAISQLEEALKVMPSNFEFHYRLGNLFYSTGQAEDAIARFQAAIRLKPDSFEAHNNLASLLAKKGEVDRAIGELQEAIRLKPENADTHYNLGALYLKQGLGDEAAGEFQTAIRLSPGNSAARYYLGTILIRKGQTEAAITQYREALRLKPDYAFAHNKLGIALGAAGRLPEAVAEFQEAVRLKPDYAEANTNLAIALKIQGAAAH